jgi:hypothetical protein
MKDPMKLRPTAAVLALLAFAPLAQANNLSFTGNFVHDNDVQQFTFTLSEASTVTLRSWSYAGGTNAAGAAIARGGFDPILALFNAAGLRVGEQDDGGCPAVAADAVTRRCFDTNFSRQLGAGSYTATVQQFDNFSRGSLAAGFQYDGAAFENFRGGFVDASGDRRDGHWAFDILNVTQAAQVDVPEPAPLALVGIGLLAMLRRRSKA